MAPIGSLLRKLYGLPKKSRFDEAFLAAIGEIYRRNKAKSGVLSQPANQQMATPMAARGIGSGGVLKFGVQNPRHPVSVPPMNQQQVQVPYAYQGAYGTGVLGGMNNPSMYGQRT